MRQTGSIPATGYLANTPAQPSGFGAAFGWIDQKFNSVMKHFDLAQKMIQGQPEIAPQNMFQQASSTPTGVPASQPAAMQAVTKLEASPYLDPNTDQRAPEKTSADCAKIKKKVDPQLYQQAVEIANKVGIDAAKFVKQLYAESSFTDKPANQYTAKGIAQITKGDRDWILKDHGVDAYSSVYNNMLAGALNMKDRLKKYNGDYRLALAGYNAGDGNVRKYGKRSGQQYAVPPFRETRDYLARILGEGVLNIG